MSWSRRNWRRQGYVILAAAAIMVAGNVFAAASFPATWQKLFHAVCAGISAGMGAIVALRLRRDSREHRDLS